MTPILETKNLTKVFSHGGQERRVVDGVSFSIAPGEVLGLVGESGSGKSTIAKLVTRLTDSTDGTVFVNGRDITHLSGRKLRRVYDTVQMVFQTPAASFDPRRTLGDGICESLRNRGVPKRERERRTAELLTQCGLSPEFALRYPHEVSGGQCQRAAIARALAGEPKLLILDEATSALDVTVQQQMMELLRDLQREKSLSYLFICHNLALVQQFCDRVLVLYEGKLVEEGAADQVILHPQSEYTKRLAEAAF